MRLRRPLARLVLLAALAACTEKISAPGICPDYCPTGSLRVVDTVLSGAITRDSAFGRPLGYVTPYQAFYLLADSLPGLRDSRPILRTSAVALRLALTTDTTTSPVIGVDSLVLRLTITRRDTSNHNLAIRIYALPRTIDSTTTFAALLGPFTDSLLRTVRLDSLIAKPGKRDAVTGDSVVVDSTNHRITVFIRLDSARVPIGGPDSGAAALGVRVSANTPASVAFAASEDLGLGPVLNWYVRLDSLGAGVAHRVETRSPTFDSFVFTPPSLALDGTLAVGGVPAARSVLRFVLPPLVTDSSQIIRATLELVPAVAAQGLAADSFALAAQAVVGDFGAKSPLDGVHVDTTIVHVGVTDTVRLEVTNILRYWIADTIAPTTLVLRQVPEGANFAEIRFYSSRDAGHRPVLRLTYAPRFPFGVP